jgi:hypothetical protein
MLRNFRILRADLVDRVGEKRVAAAEQGERERYEREQHPRGSSETSGSTRDDVRGPNR